MAPSKVVVFVADLGDAINATIFLGAFDDDEKLDE
jgi:hypothetical protein